MSFFILLYVSIILGFFYFFYTSYNQNKKSLSGKYLLLGILSFSFWLILYLISFSTTSNPHIILYISRALYTLSFIAAYAMSLFFLYYGKKKSKKDIIYWKIIIGIFIFILFLSLFSGYFIEEMLYDSSLNIYYEKFGWAFIFLNIADLINPLITFFIIIYRGKKLLGIQYSRYIYFSFGYLIFLYFFAFFLAVLPIFGIWILQKEQILFFIPFLASLFYTSHRYKFSKISIQIYKTFKFLGAIILTCCIIYGWQLYFDSIDSRLIGFWGLTNESHSSFAYSCFVISIFCITYFLLSKIPLYSGDKDEFHEVIFQLQEKLPFIKNAPLLNQTIENDFSTKLFIPHTKILFLDENEKDTGLLELKSYFIKDISRDIFLNDRVFIEENKQKFEFKKLEHLLEKKIDIFLPIYKNKGDIAGFFSVGKKNYGDYYSLGEFEILKRFSHSLEGHLKYLSTYKKLQDFSLNLDKKVDEKTIEFNTLLAKQREFIGYVSHEIKNPITNCIFLSESIQDDINSLDPQIKHGRIQEDQSLLQNELLKISHLVTHIFSTEKFDLEKVKIYKKERNLYDFLQNEITSFQASHPNFYIDTHMNDIGNKKIDDIQMRQVIQNLLNNAYKFANQDEPQIRITLQKRGDNIEISIEDNGKGFSQYDISSIFEKYNTGNGTATGLGLGLYLCKKIVELHKGSITAGNGKILKGAKFTISF